MSRPPLSPLVVRPRPEARRWTRLPRIRCSHNERSRALIDETSRLTKNELTAVLGAGACEDIPLERLAARFQRVRLFDEDGAAVDAGIAAAHLEANERGRIEIVPGDLTGVAEPLGLAIREKLRRQPLPAADETAAWIDSLAGLVDRAAWGARPDFGSPDFITVSCVLSQLHVTAVHRALGEIEAQVNSAGRGQLADAVRRSSRWTEALLSLARRLEQRMIEELATLLATGAVAYVSDTVQMCFVRLLPDGDWSSDGLYRMTRTQRLADYFDERFAVVPLGEWAWVVDAPMNAEDLGRVYRVQALRVRSNTS